MPRPVAEIVADRYAEHGYVQLRIQEHVADQADRIVTALHQKLARLVRDQDPAGSKLAERRVAKQAGELITAAYKRIDQLVLRELRDVTKLEMEQTRAVLRAAIVEALSE
jgi:hypothetical protein